MFAPTFSEKLINNMQYAMQRDTNTYANVRNCDAKFACDIFSRYSF